MGAWLISLPKNRINILHIIIIRFLSALSGLKNSPVASFSLFPSIFVAYFLGIRDFISTNGLVYRKFF